jgi:superfamily II DNA helicase RecQ
MKLKVITLRLDDATGAFDDGALRAFVEDEDRPREVLEVSEHFFVHERRPVWALLLSYRDVPRPGDKRDETRKDWRVDLDGEAQAIFDEIRRWRAQACKREGLPPYLICTNRQMAEIARSRPSTAAGLLSIHGLGEAKVKRWGEEVLAVVRAATDAGPSEEQEADD